MSNDGLDTEVPTAREAELLDELVAMRDRVTAMEAAVGLGIMEYDPDRRLVRLDLAARLLHGLESTDRSDMPLEVWAALLTADDQIKGFGFLSGDIPAGQVEHLTVRVPEPGSKKPRLLELSLRRDPQGSRLMGACRDVTQERSLEELRRQKLTAERANRAKSEFMSQVSHELRTPLNAIIGFTQLMMMDENGTSNNEQLERLAVVRHSGQRLLSLIDQLLQINRIERGRSSLQSRSVGVLDAVHRSIDALRLQASIKGVEIATDIERSESAAVRADPEAFEQVLTNLISNAIKYNRDKGQVRIRFKTGRLGELSVEDTGAGLTEAQLGKLFEPFNRLHAQNAKIPGTGLGLVITKRLVEAMGGTIDVESTLGLGTRFTVCLPSARKSRSADSDTMPLDLPSQWHDGRQCEVLYIEDDAVNQLLMEAVFKTQPEWQLHCVTTGAEGFVHAVQKSPEIILMDMNLPDMSGAEVLEKLKAHPRTAAIPCIAVSADAMPAQIARALALGFSDYWTKPIDIPVLIGKVKELLH